MRTSAEFRLFCLGLRRPLEAADRAALRAAVGAVPRWDAVLEGARRHSVAPLLLAGLQDSGAAIPRPVLDELRGAAAAAARQSLVQGAALARLAGQFTAAGIPLLVLKGVPLSLLLYGDPARRSAQDIDLLVDPADMAAAEALLAETGHRRAGAPLPGPRHAAYRRWFKEIEYTHPVHGRVELHQRLTDLADLVPWDFATLWGERAAVRVGDAAIPVLGDRHLACYLCAHGAEHAWQRLRWLTDLAALLREPGALDAAVAAADGVGLAAPMRQAIVLAHDWLGLPVAEALLARARADRGVARLDRILAHSYAGEAWRAMPRRGSLAALLRYSLWQRLYRLSIKPAWRYRLLLLRRELSSPADWAALPLPDRLAWLYPLIRPFGWLLRRGSG